MRTIIFNNTELNCPDDFAELIEDLSKCSYWSDNRLLINDDNLGEQLEHCGLASKTARGSYTSTPKLMENKDIIISQFYLKLSKGDQYH